MADAVYEHFATMPEYIRGGLNAFAMNAHNAVSGDEGAARNVFESLPFTTESMAAAGPMMAGIFAGVKAKTADVAKLGLAEDLMKKGASRDEVWNATGWFKGVDGKWRFEIPDDASKLYEFPGAGGKATSEDWADIFEHKLLKDSYSDRPSLKIVNKDDPTFRGAFYDMLDGAVVMQPTDELAKSTTLHELQHAIQKKEGFARGGMPDSMASELYNEMNKKMSYFASELDYIKAARQGTSDPKIRAHLDDQYSKVKAAYDDAMSKKMNYDPHEAYRRLAGEAEARLTQKRMNMTAAERAKRPPWMDFDVPESDQIIRYGK
jgi:hypothetical protein